MTLENDAPSPKDAARSAVSPSLEEARRLAADGECTLIPLSIEAFSDEHTPITVLRKLQNVSDHVFLLESVEDAAEWSRYTFMGCDPSMEVTCNEGMLTVVRHADGSGLDSGNGPKTVETTPTDDPNAALRALLARHKSARLEGLPPFTGGLVGYFSYDYFAYSEPSLRLDAPDEEGFKDIDLMLFDKVMAFDNLRQKIVLIANMRVDDPNGIEASYERAVRDLQAMRHLLMEGAPRPAHPGRLLSPFRPLFDQERFCKLVEDGKRFIYEGDVFQVVLSNRLDADFEGDLLDTYRVLRTTNPSPYMFYFYSDSIEMAGASPETLVRLEDGVLHTFPLAGSRPRPIDRSEDDAVEADLLSDEKELAEHNMLVDLGRNDLGRISQFGTVEVDDYLSVQKFSHIMHIGSSVRGQIRPDRDALDAVAAVLPAGTLSGAPKIRAAQIINDLEQSKRGVYGGAVGYLDFTGNLDLCIAIRLVFKRNGKVFVRSGCGVVADSVPETEYVETLNKARAVVDALEASQGGLA